MEKTTEVKDLLRQKFFFSQNNSKCVEKLTSC